MGFWAYERLENLLSVSAIASASAPATASCKSIFVFNFISDFMQMENKFYRIHLRRVLQ